MPATKLTLRLDEETIKQGKAFARSNGTSLSKLVEQFIQEKVEAASIRPPVRVVEIAPHLAALMGNSEGVPQRSKRDYLDQYLDTIRPREVASNTAL